MTDIKEIEKSLRKLISRAIDNNEIYLKFSIEDLELDIDDPFELFDYFSDVNDCGNIIPEGDHLYLDLLSNNLIPISNKKAYVEKWVNDYLFDKCIDIIREQLKSGRSGVSINYVKHVPIEFRENICPLIREVLYSYTNGSGGDDYLELFGFQFSRLPISSKYGLHREQLADKVIEYIKESDDYKRLIYGISKYRKINLKDIPYCNSSLIELIIKKGKDIGLRIETDGLRVVKSIYIYLLNED